MKKDRVLFVFTGGLFLLATALMSQTKKPAAAPVQKAIPQATMDRGKQVYLEQCLACHQVDGTGVPNMNPPLIKTKWVLGDKGPLVKVVLNGMTGDVEINDDTYHNVMAPHPDLTDQQISDVLTYVRNSWGNKAAAITPAEVKAIRAKNKPVQ
jgi:mono/diheme cytochrome c family protein